MVTHSVDYQLISKQLYNLGIDDILHHCVIEHECNSISYESHEGIVGSQNSSKDIVCKVLHIGIWWASLFADTKD
jgi:hypothetical protein